MLSDVSPFSHAVKSPLKNGQVLGMDKAIREARSWGGKQESEFPKEASEIKSVPLSHLPRELYRVTTELKGHMHSKTNTFPGCPSSAQCCFSTTHDFVRDFSVDY